MTKTRAIFKLIFSLILVNLFLYPLMAFAAFSFNPNDWSTWMRFIWGIGLFAPLAIFASDISKLNTADAKHKVE